MHSNCGSSESSSELSPLEELKPTKSGSEVELLVRLWLAESRLPQYRACHMSPTWSTCVTRGVANVVTNKLKWQRSGATSLWIVAEKMGRTCWFSDVEMSIVWKHTDAEASLPANVGGASVW